MYIPKLKIRIPDKIYTCISYTNPVLAISAFFLSGYLALLLWRPYAPEAHTARKTDYSAATAALLKELFFAPEGLGEFDESAFKGKALFQKTGTPDSDRPKKYSFVLLGVSLGEKNIAMIRDTALNKNYYCRQGDAIGHFRVTQIFKDKVILMSASETIEIRR